MKPKSTLRHFLLAASSALLAVSSSHAADGIWTGTTGDWSNTGVWSSGIIADGQDAALTTTSLNANRILTLDSDRSVGSITFTHNSSSSYTIDSSGGSKLDLDVSSGMPFVRASSRFQKSIISADLIGDNGLEITNNGSGESGVIVLSGNNTYTGGTKLTLGTIHMGSATAISTGTITFNGGGLASSDATNYTLNNAIELTGNVFIGKQNASNPNPGSGSLTFSNTAATALGATRTFDVFTNVKATFAQSFSGNTFGITKSGSGTLELTGANTYTGTTTVSAGALILSGSNNSAGTTTVSGGTLQLNSNSNGGLASGTISQTGGTIQAIGNDRTISNAITTGTASFSFSGDYSLTTGELASTGTNNRILFNNIASGKTLTIGGFTISNRQVYFRGTGTTIIDGVVSVGSGGINKDDSGTLILNGSNSLGNTTFINAGVVNIRNGSALGVAGKAAEVKSGAALEIQGDITTPSISLSLNGTGISNGGALRNISGTNSLGGLITLQSASRINSDAGTLTVDVASGNAITGTFDLTFGGAGNTTVADNIDISTGILTKDGDGTTILSGTNTYTGATHVNAGTLVITGATQATGAITFDSGGVLGLDTGVSVTAASAAVDLTDGAIQVTGTIVSSSYTLLTAVSITGAPVLASPVPGYELQIVNGNELRLVDTGAPSNPYDAWATGGELFDADANGDGVDNGMAFLLGASGPNVNALGLLPAVSESAGGLVLTFQMLDATARGTATLALEHSNSLATGSWTTVSVPDTSSTLADVVFTVTGTGPLNVTATIPASKAASGKLFGRLKATE